jgi:ABC-type nitrate/sulfonate/bicarbonate transport system substrate-binding protein
MKKIFNQCKTIVFAAAAYVSFALSFSTTAEEAKIHNDATMSKQSRIKLIKVSLLLDWKPNTNHTGFFVARDKGYFSDVGLDVTIVNPSPTSGTVLVGSGKADFGVSYANNLIHAQESNVPVVAIAAIVQPDSSCFIWRESSGIKSIKDFEGKRYAGWGSPEEAATIKFVMEKNGADFSKIKILTVGVSDFLQSTERNADITWEYKAWGMLSPVLHGVKIGFYCPSEHFPELKKPSPLLLTSQKLLQANPELVKKFVAASRKGFEYAIDHPNQAAEILAKCVTGLDKEFVIKSQEILSPMYRADAEYWGYISPQQFELYGQWMKTQGLIKKEPQLNQFILNVQKN